MIRSILLAAMFMAAPSSAQSIVGSWATKNAGQAKSAAVITFLADGTYTMAEDGDRKADPNGRDGMERGTYQWNESKGRLTTKTLVDTTREWGLSHTKFKKVTITGNKMTAVLDDARLVLNRVTTKANPIVGGWYLKTGAKSYAVVTFLADGSYFMVEDGKPSGGGRTGMERGTYKWNPLTKSFSCKVTVDTNGTWGFSDQRKTSVSVSGNKLTLTDGEKFVLKRVVSTK